MTVRPLLALAGLALAGAELAKRGKAATARVVTEHQRVVGAAFVVHPDGLLVTCGHVVALAGGGPVRVVLRPGGPDEKVVAARVVRTGTDPDLARWWAPLAESFVALLRARDGRPGAAG